MREARLPFILQPVIGTVLNVAGIVAGGIAGKVRSRPISAANDSFFKVTLSVFTVYYGLRLTWTSLNGSVLRMLQQLLLVIVALMLGQLLGRALRLQSMSNALGRKARERMESAEPTHPNRLNDGFKTCAALFCAAPLGILGAIQDGLSGYFFPLVIKGVMEGLATYGLVGLFGGGVILSALPVLAVQGSVTVLAWTLQPWLAAHGLIDSINATGGLLVFSVALVMLGLKKIALADYLPSLVVAPLLTALFR